MKDTYRLIVQNGHGVFDSLESEFHNDDPASEFSLSQDDEIYLTEDTEDEQSQRNT